MFQKIPKIGIFDLFLQKIPFCRKCIFFVKTVFIPKSILLT